MDGIPLGYSFTADVDADFFEYSGVNIPPTDNVNAKSLFYPQSSSSDQLSLQGTWQQHFYRSSSNQQSSLSSGTSSFEGVGVSSSAVFIYQSQY